MKLKEKLRLEMIIEKKKTKPKKRMVNEVNQVNELRKSSRIATQIPISYKKMMSKSNDKDQRVTRDTIPDSDTSDDESVANLVRIKVMFTNIHNVEEKNYYQHVVLLRGEVVTNICYCTHMISVVPIVRTQKLFGAIRFAKFIVSLDWLTDSMNCGRFLDEDKYLLKDLEAENLWKFNLQQSMKRAHKTGVFYSCKFFISSMVLNEKLHKELRQIIETGGGVVVKEVTKTIVGFCFIVIREEEKQTLREKYSSYGHNIYFIDPEFIFLTILRQKLSMEGDLLQYIFEQ